MYKKLVGAVPYFCEKSNTTVILETFEDEVITEDKITPIKIIHFSECLSSGSIPDCSICPNVRK